MIAELCSESSDIADQAGSGEAASSHLGQSLTAHLRPQIRDIGGIERYDGLTPVTITL